jgi:hypothetical protein
VTSIVRNGVGVAEAPLRSQQEHGQNDGAREASRPERGGPDERNSQRGAFAGAGDEMRGGEDGILMLRGCVTLSGETVSPAALVRAG